MSTTSRMAAGALWLLLAALAAGPARSAAEGPGDRQPAPAASPASPASPTGPASPASPTSPATPFNPAAAPGPAAAPPAPESTRLPEPVRAALARAGLPPSALSVWLQAVDAPSPRLAAGARQPVNPASLFKLVTTLAALELLGPAYTWSTPVWLTGPVRSGVLQGDLVIQGRGDPRLTPERLWLLMRRVQQLGVREIRGDIVLDRSAFAPPEGRPGDFDGEPLRPYNVAADALLLANRAVVYAFSPDPATGVAHVSVEPVLDGHRVQAEVRLSNGPCDDWRAGLGATPADAAQMRFAGRYPAACGERLWPLAWPQPADFDRRLLTALWRETGGSLRGRVRDGSAPADRAPAFALASPPLAELVRDINKWSLNTAAQQLFLTLGLAQAGSGSPEAARAVLQRWLAEVAGDPALVDPALLRIDNGSGLSREGRLSAELLGRVLLRAWSSALMPDLLASLPLAGTDGTARRLQGAVGRAHLKTGSLRDVMGVAGILHGSGGRRWVLVAVIQHPQAPQGRPALDALQQWAIQTEGPP